jgi:hypothetical protein
MMKRDLRFSRRRLLKSIGAGAALLPMLRSDPTDAACYVGGIKRMYILAWTNGMLSSINKWATTGNDPTSWTLGDFQASLQPYMSDLLLLNGIDYKLIKDQPGSGERTGHSAFPGMLTGAYYSLLSSSTSSDLGGGISIDQYIGNQLQQGGYKGLVSLNQGTFVVSTGHLSWVKSGQVVLPTTDPAKVFSLYLQGAVPTPPPATTPTKGTDAGVAPVDNTNAIRKSILDYVIADINRFSNVVGTDDKASIDEHLTSVRNIETRIQNLGSTSPPIATMGGGPITTNTGNAACNMPSTAGEPGSSAAANAPAITKLHMDLGVAAFAADLTRVIVMQIGDQGDSNLIPSWLPGAGFAEGLPALASDPNTGNTNGFHAIAHENTMRKVTVDTWFQSQYAYIVGQLKGITDGTGKSMLDSSVVVAMNSMRTGTHETTGVPVALAGSCGNYFKTGRSLALPAGTPNNGLLVSLCNAMGFPVTTFGQASYGGAIAGLTG